MDFIRQTICLALAALTLALGFFCVRAEKTAPQYFQTSIHAAAERQN